MLHCQRKGEGRERRGEGGNYTTPANVSVVPQSVQTCVAHFLSSFFFFFVKLLLLDPVPSYAFVSIGEDRGTRREVGRGKEN